ncbi:MAG: HEAT repeat domain-containing protein [Planctomycetota bacterium]
MRLPATAALIAALSLAAALVVARPLVAGAAPIAAPTAFAQEEDESLDALIEKLRTEKEEADATLFTKLVKTRDAKAGEALIAIYDEMGSAGGKLRVVRSLPPFAEIDAVAAKVVEKLSDIATGDRRRLLRYEALTALSKCKLPGRQRLRAIVESPADDQIRIEAMRLHTAEQPSAEDTAWYRKIWKPDEDADGKKRRDDKKKSDEKEPRRLVDVRRLAFQALLGSLKTEELIEALDEEESVNVRGALAELTKRKSKEAADKADSIFGSQEADPLVRIEAAKLLLDQKGEDFLGDAERVGSNRQTPAVVREAVADMVASRADDKLLKKLAKDVTKGKAEEKIFYALACKKYADEKLDKSYRKLIDDKEPEVRIVAMGIVADRGDKEALEDLAEVLEKRKGREEAELAACLEAISKLREGEIAWGEQVREYVASTEQALRNAAIAELGRRKDSGALDVLKTALEHTDWSTRLAAVDALVEIRNERAVPLLIDRLAKEDGRMETAVAEALFSLTGQPFQKRAQAWEQWWKAEGAAFKCITPQELRTLEREAELQRLELRSAVKEFFGIQIDSHRVAFVIDVSGSMEEKAKGQYVDEDGEMRIVIAKKELTNFLDGLEPGAYFNLIPFSDRARPWQEQMVKNEGEVMVDAKEFVDDLVPSGATNLYDGLQTAFADPETDTIVVLSDGEPTDGEIIEITEIRRRVKEWNEHRGIVIHTVQIGATFEILKWLAEDSGGETVLIP